MKTRRSTERRFRVLASAVTIGLLAGCGSSAPDTAEGPAAEVPISAEAFEAHLRFLADDLLEGREAGTRGYDLAAAYVASQFRQFGLKPAGTAGGYLQRVELLAHRLVPGSAQLVLRRRAGPGPARSLRFVQDYLTGSSALRQQSEVRADAVFVGFGIDAPALRHNDYDGLEVAGKIAVTLAGAPATFPSEEGAHYGAEKVVQAAERGAVGVIGVYTDAFEQVVPWHVAQMFGPGRTGMSWIGPDGVAFDEAPTLQGGALMSSSAAALLFEGAARSYQQVREEARTAAPRGFPLAVTLQLAQRSIHERRSSANVVAVIEGSDPALRHEHVVAVAHLDHEGVGPPIDGDAIYNGAMDNAAGIAALLEAARALAAAPVRPRRSILFLAVTAEEKGLVGADYFARHPTVPRESLAAVVNLDMPVLLYDFTDVVAFGAEHSTLGGVLASTLAEMNLTLTPDPTPEEATFTRSDHYAFVRQGVPALYVTPGVNARSGRGEGKRFVAEFLTKHYHRPSDDMKQPIDFAAGARFASLNARLLRAIADAGERPAWNEGDFFGTLSGK